MNSKCDSNMLTDESSIELRRLVRHRRGRNGEQTSRTPAPARGGFPEGLHLRNALLEGEAHEVGFLVDVELSHQVLPVDLDGVDGPPQIGRDLLGGPALGDELEDPALLGGKRDGPPRDASRPGALQCFLHQEMRNVGAQSVVSDQLSVISEQ